MRALVLLLVAAAFLACSAPDPAPEPSSPPASATDVGSPAPAPASDRPGSGTADSTDRDAENGGENGGENAGNVILESPQAGQTVGNPVQIAGRARTFENNVEIRLETPGGQALREGYATARGELGQFNPFSTEIFLTTDPGSSIRIRLIERSMKDGSIRSSDSAMVRVRPERTTVRLHFPNSGRWPNDCSRVGQVVRNLPTSVAPARLAIEALMAGPEQGEQIRGYTNPFPDDADLRSINLSGGTVTVDFNQRLQNVGGSCRAQAIRAAVEQTLRAIEGIDRVVITAGGSESLALQP